MDGTLAPGTDGRAGTAPGGRPYGATGSPGGWSYARALVRREGLAGTIVRVATYPNTPWVRYGWAPLVVAARRLTGARAFEGPDGPLPYGPAVGERTIEVPIGRSFLERRRPLGPALEVGNVLAHYGTAGHRVVDKYEPAPGVENVDVVDYRPDAPFPTIVAISTLEHVGFDEEPRTPGKFARALEHLYRDCLAPGGELLVTVPLGYNPEVDAAVYAGHPALGEVTLYRHHGLRNLWERLRRPDWPAAAELPPYNARRHVHAYVAVARAAAPPAPSASQPSSA